MTVALNWVEQDLLRSAMIQVLPWQLQLGRTAPRRSATCACTPSMLELSDDHKASHPNLTLSDLSRTWTWHGSLFHLGCWGFFIILKC